MLTLTIMQLNSYSLVTKWEYENVVQYEIMNHEYLLKTVVKIKERKPDIIKFNDIGLDEQFREILKDNEIIVDNEGNVWYNMIVSYNELDKSLEQSNVVDLVVPTKWVVVQSQILIESGYIFELKVLDNDLSRFIVTL